VSSTKQTPTLGELIAYHRRRRGLSQARFADLLDRSVSWVSQVERGIKPVDRLPVLREVARVLEVPPAELLPESMLPVAAEREDPVATTIRLLLSGHPSLAAELKADAGRPLPSIDLEDLEAKARHAWELAHASRFLELGELVAGLVPELEAAARQLDGEPQRTAFGLLSDTYQAIAAVLTKLGETAAAWAAAERSVAAAERAGLPLLAAAGDLRLAQAFLSAGQLDQAERVVSVAAAALEPAVRRDSPPELLSLWGTLNLIWAIIATRQGQERGALDHMSKAETAAKWLGEDRDDFGTQFGPTNVSIQAVMVAVELGDAGTALRRAKTVDASKLLAERRARFLIDVARAYHQRRQSDDVLRTLAEAEALTPEQVRSHRYVREMVRDLLRDERRPVTPELRALAKRVGALA
jgi:transcriptional regulator with XRE-family HTH domain